MCADSLLPYDSLFDQPLAFGGPGHRNPATTSMAHNRLTAIEGANEHEEEEWETYMRRLPNEDEVNKYFSIHAQNLMST